MKLKQNSRKRFRKKIALVLAIFIHFILLFIHFQKSVQKSSGSQHIEISMVRAQEVAKKNEIKNINDSPEVVTVKAPMEDLIHVTQKPKPKLRKLEKEFTSKHAKAIHGVVESIDSRKIYAIDNNNQQKQTAAHLDIEGWEWDSTPLPNDKTDEVGTIIFDIIIDKSGFVVGIKEKEKNISPQLAALYKESIANLTFSKVSEFTRDQQTIKGTVTFIIHSK